MNITMRLVCHTLSLTGMAIAILPATASAQVKVIPAGQTYVTAARPPQKSAPRLTPSRTLGVRGSTYRLHGVLSDVFLVRGKDVSEAAHATAEILHHGHPANRAVGSKQDKAPKLYWLAAYLGTGSGISFEVESVQQKGKTITLRYKNRLSSVPALFPYFCWARLGQLQPGAYTLQLFDAEGKLVVLTRRVVVP